METDPLLKAKEYLNDGNREGARFLLRKLIIADLHNIPAWLSFLKTMTTDRELSQAISIFYKNNPGYELPLSEYSNLRSQVFQDDPQDKCSLYYFDELGIKYVVTKTEYKWNKTKQRRLLYRWPKSLVIDRARLYQS